MLRDICENSTLSQKKLLIKGICHKKLIQHDNKIKLFFKIENIVLLYINYQMFSYIYHYIINFVILFCQKFVNKKLKVVHFVLRRKKLQINLYYTMIINRSQYQSLNYSGKKIKTYCFQNLVIKGEKIIQVLLCKKKR